jgi:hypothetical protein
MDAVENMKENVKENASEHLEENAVGDKNVNLIIADIVTPKVAVKLPEELSKYRHSIKKSELIMFAFLVCY